MRLLILVIAILLLPALVGSAAASVVAAPPAARIAPLFSWVPAAGYPDAFPFGQCTWWAAYNHRVTWGGNAADWITNAKREGIVVSDSPSVGAIAVYRPGGAYSSYGHVALVTAVNADTYAVSEMNAPAWGIVVTRVVRLPDGDVIGFIPSSDQ